MVSSHIFENLFSPGTQNEMWCVAVTCYAKGEMTEQYLTFSTNLRTS